MLKRKNISDNIYDKIKSLFIEGELNFGEKIGEIELCNKLEVSRTPLREAIKQLEIEGIIERTPNGRLKIMDMDLKRIDEIFQIRCSLEDLILDNIIQNKEFIKEMENNLNLTKFQIELENWEETRKLFSDFNKILYKYSQLEFTIKILKNYSFILQKLRLNSLEKSDRIRASYEEHILLLEHLKNGDIEKAKQLNKKHLLKAKQSVIEYFLTK